MKQKTELFVHTNKLKYLLSVPLFPLVEFEKCGPSIWPSSSLRQNHRHNIGVGTGGRVWGEGLGVACEPAFEGKHIISSRN